MDNKSCKQKNSPTNNRIYLKKLLKIEYLSVLLFIVLCFSSCTSYRSDLFEKGNYKVDIIDTSYFKNYYSIFLVNKENDTLWLLSKKVLNEDSITNYEQFCKIKSNEFVKLSIFKYNNLKVIKSNKVALSDNIFFAYLKNYNTILWENDTIKEDVYYSPQLIGLYVLKEKIMDNY